MNKKLKEILQSKSFYIFSSIIIGILLWLFVLNYSNPVIERTLEIPLTIENQNYPATKELINTTVTYPTVVTVTVKGREDIVNNLLLSELYSSVDFSEVKEPGEIKLNVSKPTCSRYGIRIEDYYPKQIDFVFDKRMETYLDVRLIYDDSLLKENYKFINVTAEPDSIPVSDLSSLVEKLEEIQVNLSDSIARNSIDGNKTASFIGRYISKRGEDVSHYFNNTVTITVKIEVAKEVPLVYSVVGEPETDFYIDSSSLSSTTVLLQGSAADLSRISSINLGAYDVTGRSEDYVREINISDFLPERVSVYGNNKVTLTVDIEEYQIKEFEITDTILSKPGMELDVYEYVISPDVFIIKIKGKEKDLKTLQRSSLNPTLDLTDRSVGIYSIPLKITLDERFELIGEYIYEVNISLLEPDETEEPEEP